MSFEEEVQGGCVECHYGFVLSSCDGVGHAEVELQRCDTCETFPGDDEAQACFIRIAEWLMPQELTDFYNRVLAQARKEDPRGQAEND